VVRPQSALVNQLISADTLNKLDGFIEMSTGDIRFLEKLLRETRVEKALEVGVSAGGSSALLLSLFPRDANTALYAVDYKHHYHRDRSRKAGFLVAERFPEFLANYHLFTGDDVSGFIDEIGGDIDLALIDTSHSHPIETLNVLTILPFMKPGAWIVLHDIGIFLKPFYNAFATKYIFDAWQGERIESEFKSESIDAANIGAIRVERLEENTRQLLSVLFNRWDKDVPEKDIAQTRAIIEAHYTTDDLKTFDRAVDFNRRYLEQVNSVRKNLKDVEMLLRARWRRLFRS
jgi:predicted O-methyltransferase YrrM